METNIEIQSENIETEYLLSVFPKEVFRVKVKRATQILRRMKNKFDAIAFRGTSGSAFAFPLSYTLSKSLICVRKGGKASNSHIPTYTGFVEGTLSSINYIIVDDFIQSGTTIKVIKEKVKEFYKKHEVIPPTYVGTLLYGCYPEDLVKFIPN